MESFRKLSISDILNATEDQNGNGRFVLVSNKGNVQPLVFKNVRFYGLIVELRQQNFVIDDGSGIIEVEVLGENNYSVKVGDYVEVFGEVSNRKLKLINISFKQDPNAEVRYLLESAWVHKENFQFQFITDSASQFDLV